MKGGKISIARVNSNARKPCINITVYDAKHYGIVFEGFMELEDFAKVITGQGNIDLKYRVEEYEE